MALSGDGRHRLLLETPSERCAIRGGQGDAYTEARATSPGWTARFMPADRSPRALCASCPHGVRRSDPRVKHTGVRRGVRSTCELVADHAPRRFARRRSLGVAGRRDRATPTYCGRPRRHHTRRATRPRCTTRRRGGGAAPARVERLIAADCDPRPNVSQAPSALLAISKDRSGVATRSNETRGEEQHSDGAESARRNAVVED
jgi:hypothetical protein